jgi:hypothetical protein
MAAASPPCRRRHVLLLRELATPLCELPRATARARRPQPGQPPATGKKVEFCFNIFKKNVAKTQKC